MLRLRRFLRKPSLRGVGPGLLCALVAGLLTSQLGIARGLDDWLFDGCFSARDQLSELLEIPRPPAPVVIIGLDEEDFDSLRKPIVFMSPELAEVVVHARNSGATAVGVDMMIPSSLSDLPQIVKHELGKATDLGRAIRDNANGGVVLSIAFNPDGTVRQPVRQWLLKYDNPDYRDKLDRDLGAVDLLDDDDGIVRQALLVRSSADDRLYPSFALALLAWAENKPYAWDSQRQAVLLGDDVIPTNEGPRMRINYAGPPGTFPKVSFRRVLDAARTKEVVPELNGKIAIIGATARDIQDYHATPYSNGYAYSRGQNARLRMAGAEIHANTIATILNQRYITRPWWLHPWPWLAVFGVGLGWLFARLGLLAGLGVAVGYFFAWHFVAVLLFTVGQWRADLFGTLFLGFLTYGFVFAQRWRVLRRVLAATKSQALAKALEDDPARLDLAGENRIVTVMFTDVRGFSSFSANHRDQPQQIVALLNAYFTAVIPAIEAEGGTVTTFMGDGMMILFNAPVEHPDHALRALRAARAMIRTIREHSTQFTKLGCPSLRAGIGINTGTCTIGAVGSPTRIDYTSIGDVTNAAARLEAATKEAGVDILIGAETYRMIPEKLRPELGCSENGRMMDLKGVGRIEVFAVDAD